MKNKFRVQDSYFKFDDENIEKVLKFAEQLDAYEISEVKRDVFYCKMVVLFFFLTQLGFLALAVLFTWVWLLGALLTVIPIVLAYWFATLLEDAVAIAEERLSKEL